MKYNSIELFDVCVIELCYYSKFKSNFCIRKIISSKTLDYNQIIFEIL